MSAVALKQLDSDLWVVDAPLSMLGIRVGTRMTVVRMRTGGLWLHSPVSIDAGLRQALDSLGPVEFVVAPNKFHHLFVGEAASTWPSASIYGVPGLEKKRQDVSFDAMLGRDAASPWTADLDQIAIEGTLLEETVFFHRGSRTLITSDLAENCLQAEHLPTRLYARLCGVTDRFAVPWLLRICYRDKPRARAGLERVLQWDFDRVILAHGQIVERGGKEQVREAYRWLLSA